MIFWLDNYDFQIIDGVKDVLTIQIDDDVKE